MRKTAGARGPICPRGSRERIWAPTLTKAVSTRAPVHDGQSRTVCPARGVRQLDDSTMNGMWQSLKPAS